MHNVQIFRLWLYYGHHVYNSVNNNKILSIDIPCRHTAAIYIKRIRRIDVVLMFNKIKYNIL